MRATALFPSFPTGAPVPWSKEWVEMDQEPEKSTVTFASPCCHMVGLLLSREDVSIFRYSLPPLNQHIPC